MTESRAIRLCLKERDPAGFEFLVARYRREAYFHARALLGNESDAADACQEAFLRAFAAMPRLGSLDRFYPWFYRILRNVCLNMLSRARTRHDYAAAAAAAGAGDGAPTDGGAPDDLVAAREDREAVWRVLAEVSAAHREILTLKYVHGFRYEEIAATLGIPRGTVMSRLYAARQAFRKLYETDQSANQP